MSSIYAWYCTSEITFQKQQIRPQSTPEMENVSIGVHVTATLDRYLGEDFIDFRKLGGGELNLAARDILQVALLVSVSLCSLNHPRE